MYMTICPFDNIGSNSNLTSVGFPLDNAPSLQGFLLEFGTVPLYKLVSGKYAVYVP